MLHGPPLSFLPTPVIFCRSYRRSMTRQLLHRNNIYPSIKEVRAKRAPKIVGTKRLHPSEKRPPLQDFQHTILRHAPALNFSPFPNRVQQRSRSLSPQLQPFGLQGATSAPEALQANVCVRSNPPKNFCLLTKISPEGKEYPVVIKKKGLANTTRPQLINVPIILSLNTRKISHTSTITYPPDASLVVTVSKTS